MKKNILLSILTILFLACDKNGDGDTDSKETSSLLTGKWELVEITSEDGRIGSATSTSSSYFEMLFHGEGSNLDVVLSFSENPNAFEIIGEGFLYERIITDTTGDIEISGGKFLEQWPFAYDFLNPGNGWKVEEKKYLYHDERGSLWVDHGAEILELNETTLKLKMDYNEDWPKTGGYIGKETSTFYATFNKI
ncbi:hypothetical protein [Flagellimonas pacifica]|uniref:Lipocalin-like domain-containing protein n=1 Tax=Flagellimonas pacifica TaxID=1247520 RepID=A0A285MUP2_9FLAO|nr:hypothetical protein [Allomuricauda parva]SNZ00894.1 hypothetical protein SAMN06265377_2721 [Allomuricauda parva]